MYVWAKEAFMTPSANASTDPATAKCELAGEVLRSFGSLRFAATGWSMLPTIWPGDTLVVERVPPDQFRVGDIALVGRKGTLCVHRIICLPEAGDGFWITQGDALQTPDHPVIESELLGLITRFIRSGKSMGVPASLTVFERLLAQIIRRSVFSARVFVYATGRLQARRESILQCQS